MFTNVRIKTFSWIVALSLFASILATISTSYISIRNAEKVEATWTKFEHVSAQKALLLSQIRSLLGYTGMIHHFKNYLLRNNARSVIAIHKNFLELSVAFTAYQYLGLDELEARSFDNLLETVENYKEMTAVAELLVLDNHTPKNIDNIVKINDARAAHALKTLERRLTSNYRRNTENVTSAVQEIAFYSKVFGASLIALLLFVSILTIWYTHWRMVLPLNELVKSFKKINPRDPGDRRLPVDEKWGNSELSQLAKSGNAYIGAVSDQVSSRQRAEEELRDNEEHLRSIVDTAVDAIITIDDNGTITSFNTAASTLFYYEEEDVIGQNVSILMPPPHREAHDDYLKAHHKTGESSVIGVGREVEAMRKDGKTFPIRIGVSKTTTSKGVSFTGIIRDLSQQKQSEIRLQMAKEAAETANMAKSEFLSSMSHELRTPMNAINGFTQLLLSNKQSPPDEKQHQYLSLILKSGDHLLGLIDQVLELNKIETGHLDVNIVELDPHQIIDECIESFITRAEDAGLKLENRCNAQTPLIMCSDPLRIRQIVLNFLSNALKYNKPEGHIYVDSRIRKNGTLRITVHDTGIGIPKDKQSALFQPFNRLGLENGDIEGTGIGLTITDRVAEALGGKVGFESIENEGSDFWVDLPLDIKKQQTSAFH